MRSYTSGSSASASTWTEFRNLFKGVRRASRNMRVEVELLINEVRRAEATLKDRYGFAADGCKVLEVGVGQLPRQIAYFARNNEVLGIDLDVIPRGFCFPQYWKLYRSNGLKRLVKTVVRKVIGMDGQFERELCRVLSIDKIPRPTLIPMDATKMDFEDASFDFVYSFNVFEHLPEPVQVLSEIKRILKPGGCVVNHFHLYTSDSGGHDVRILSGDRENMPYWPHLRPRYRDFVKNAAYINRIRIPEWKTIFTSELPGCFFECWRDDQYDVLYPEFRKLKEAGEVSEYSEVCAHHNQS